MRAESSPSIERALGLLELLLAQPQGATLADLRSRLDISRSSLFVLLGTLRRLGYIEQSERRGRYRAGPRLLAWRSQASPITELQTAFYQEASAAGLGETLALVLPLNGEVILAAQVESSEQVRSIYPAGHRFKPESAAAQVLAPSPSAGVRQRGCAVVQDVQSVELALPVCADGQTPNAALVMSAPAFRWRKARLNNDLLRLREIAARLSYRQGALRYTPWQPAVQPADIAQRPLDPKAIRAFLAAPWVARLACLRPDGAPHVVPVWQAWDGAHFFVAAWQGSLWAEYVLANPNVSLSVDEPWPPLRRVLARGKAIPLRETDFPGGLSGLLERLRRRYLGAGGRLTQTTWQAFRITPATFTAWQGLPA
jgi:DNA-binding IclR family transcriptional regulator